MNRRRGNNTWLFAFTDLAFLLLISLSLVPSTGADFSLRLAQMDLPAVPENRTLHPAAAAEATWELRILPAPAGSKPFRLLNATEEAGIACDEQDLLPALQQLHDLGVKPVLLPDKLSLSQDFLFAAGALARVWSVEANPVVVKPVPMGEAR